jgi:H+/Cl- antiporter ClcA
MASLNVFLIIYFALVTVTSGLSVSAGLFVPMLIIGYPRCSYNLIYLGATFGRIIGRMVAAVFSGLSTYFHVALTYLPSGLNPPIDTSIYALVGSAAMMAGFSRTTISLCVILIELTESNVFQSCLLTDL